MEKKLAEIAKNFYTDPRWEKIVKLRKEGKNTIANDLMHQIHKDYGVD